MPGCVYQLWLEETVTLSPGALHRLVIFKYPLWEYITNNLTAKLLTRTYLTVSVCSSKAGKIGVQNSAFQCSLRPCDEKHSSLTSPPGPWQPRPNSTKHLKSGFMLFVQSNKYLQQRTVGFGVCNALSCLKTHWREALAHVLQPLGSAESMLPGHKLVLC